MEDTTGLARSLKDQAPGKTIGEIDHELSELEKVVLYRLKAPSEDLYESERKLEALGLERARLAPALAIEIGRTAIERARALAERLGLQVALPSSNGEADEADVKKWADGWIALVRKDAKLSERLQSATKRRAKLSGELDQLLPAEERLEEVEGEARRRAARQGRGSDAEEPPGRIGEEGRGGGDRAALGEPQRRPSARSRRGDPRALRSGSVPRLRHARRRARRADRIRRCARARASVSPC